MEKNWKKREKDLENNFYILPYANIKFDTRDDFYFPKTGLKFNAIAKYNLLSDLSGFEPYFMLNGTLENHFTFFKKITLNTEFSFGTILGEEETPVLFKNRFGGVFDNKLLNFNKFY